MVNVTFKLRWTLVLRPGDQGPEIGRNPRWLRGFRVGGICTNFRRHKSVTARNLTPDGPLRGRKPVAARRRAARHSAAPAGAERRARAALPVLLERARSGSVTCAARCRSPTASRRSRPSRARSSSPARRWCPGSACRRAWTSSSCRGGRATSTGERRAGGLALDVGGLHAVRSGIELAVATSFDADVAVVDKLPLGPGGELTDALEALRGFPRCRVVLGLRDIDDAPERVRREWGPDDARGDRALLRRDPRLRPGVLAGRDPLRSAGRTSRSRCTTSATSAGR